MVAVKYIANQHARRFSRRMALRLRIGTGRSKIKNFMKLKAVKREVSK